MTARVVLAGVLGGIGMYIWESAVHISPLGMIGIKTLAHEDTVSEALKAGAGSDGLYLFPAALDAPPSTPSGFLVYHSTNAMAMTPVQLGGEFIKELVTALILAFLIAQMRATSFASRIAFATAAGLMVTLSTNVSYRIWYGFPTDYTLASIAVDTIGFVVAGAVIAKILPRPVTRMRAAEA